MMKKKSLRAIFIVCLLCVVTAAAIGYRLYNKPHRSAATETAITLSAASLAAAYEKDEAGSNKKYLGQVLQVSGAVSGISLNQQHKPVIIFSGSGMSGVQCSLLEEIPGVKKGDSLTIKGFCAGYLSDVIIDRCVVVH